MGCNKKKNITNSKVSEQHRPDTISLASVPKKKIIITNSKVSEQHRLNKWITKHLLWRIAVVPETPRRF